MEATLPRVFYTIKLFAASTATNYPLPTSITDALGDVFIWILIIILGFYFIDNLDEAEFLVGLY
jgi:hypothetical protein